MDAPTAMVGLGRSLSLAVLILQSEEVGLACLGAVVGRAEEVGFPSISTAAALVHAGVEAPPQLREHVSVMQRLQARQLLFWLAPRRRPACAISFKIHAW